MLDRNYYTPEELAQMFKLSLSTVYNLINRGELPCVKLGKCYRISQSELEQYLQIHSKHSTLRSKRRLPPVINRLLALIKESPEKDNIQSLKLYGSYARGDYDSHSDIDLLIILKRSSIETSDAIAELSDEAMASKDYEDFLSIIQLSQKQWEKAKKSKTPFYKAVTKEGIELWKK